MRATATTRFAPSPTGALHLGHAYAALFAAARGARFVLRHEDIDPARVRAECVAAIEADLAWLGLAWERPAWRQSARLAVYGAALERLRGEGLLYPCFCTRADIAASAGAPHELPGGAPPSALRAPPPQAGRNVRRAPLPFTGEVAAQPTEGVWGRARSTRGRAARLAKASASGGWRANRTRGGWISPHPSRAPAR